MSEQAPTFPKPFPKEAQRLQRSALAKIATDRKLSALTIENQYGNVRSALAHLLAHSRYRSNIEDMIRDIVQKTVALLAHPELEAHAQWKAKVAAAAANLDRERQNVLAESAIKQHHVQIFLDVVNETIAGYQRGKLDASDVVTPQMYALAQMMLNNFEAYDATLNT